MRLFIESSGKAIEKLLSSDVRNVVGHKVRAITVDIPVGMYEEMCQLAQDDEVSLEEMCRSALVTYLRREAGEPGDDSHDVTVDTHQTINEATAIRVLVDDILSRRSELALHPGQFATLEQSIESVQEQLKGLQPNASAIAEGLKTVRNVLEGAVGSTLAAAWLPALTRLQQSLL